VSGVASDEGGGPPAESGSPWLARPALDFLALTLAALGAVVALTGWPRWLLLWPAAAWGALAWAFHANRPELLGKRPDGSRSSIAGLFWLPYLFFPRLVRLYKRLVGMDPVPWHEVAPGLWLGRRPTRGERPPAVDVAVAEVPPTPPRRLAKSSLLLPLPPGAACPVGSPGATSGAGKALASNTTVGEA
jgi:hypothetical protein